MSIYTILHFSLMSIAAVCLISAAVIANKKKDTQWLKKHRTFASFGVLAAIAGAVIMIIHKQMAGYPHFTSPHAIGGLVTATLLLVTPTLGILLLQGKEGLRSVHKIFGRVTLIFVIVTAVFGLLSLLAIMKII